MTVIKYNVQLFGTPVYDSLSCEHTTVVKLFIYKSGTIIRVQMFKLQCIRSLNYNSVIYTSLSLLTNVDTLKARY